MQCLYSSVDALLSAHPDREQGKTAIDFRHCNLNQGNIVLIGRETNTDGNIPCWLIHFSHADIFFSKRNDGTGEFERKHLLVGSIPRQDQELNFVVATSAAHKNKVGALVKMWSVLLCQLSYRDAARFS